MAIRLKVSVADALNKGVRWIMRGAGNNGQNGSVKVLSVTPMTLNGQLVQAVKLSFPPKVETVTDPRMLAALLARTEAVVTTQKREPVFMTPASAKVIGLSDAELNAISESEAEALFSKVRGA